MTVSAFCGMTVSVFCGMTVSAFCGMTVSVMRPSSPLHDRDGRATSGRNARHPAVPSPIG